jgi:hypothetical protein
MKAVAVFLAVLAVLLGFAIWQLDYLRRMMRHTQNCLALGSSSDLWFRTGAHKHAVEERHKKRVKQG